MTSNINSEPLQSQEQVAIYIPTHNRAALLKRCLKSVFAQDWKNLEVIVVDDGSSDETPELLTLWASKEGRLRVYRNRKPLGSCASRNLAISKAKSKFICGLDDDDTILPNHVSSMIAVFNPDKHAFVCSGFIWRDSSGSKPVNCYPHSITLDKQLYQNQASNQVLSLTERFLAIGGFDEDMPASQDYDTWTRFLIEYGDAYCTGLPTMTVHTDHDHHRISASKRHAIGLEKYINKHRHLMHQKHLDYQRVALLRARDQRLPTLELLKWLNTPFATYTFLYWLKTNLSIVYRFFRYIRNKTQKLAPL